MGIELWPNNSVMALCITGDVDKWTDLVDGRLEGIFDVLDEYDVRYTFFVTGKVCLDAPDFVRKMVERGDEVAGHGEVHVGFKGESYDVQKARMQRMIDIFENVIKVKIRGFRAPYQRGDVVTSKVANDLGLLYDSTNVYSEPWWIKAGGTPINIKSRALKALIKQVQSNDRLRSSIKQVQSNDRLRRISKRIINTEVLSMKGAGKSLPFNPIHKEEYLRVLQIPASRLDDFVLIDVLGLTDWRKIAKVWKKTVDNHCKNGDLYVLLAHPLRIGRMEYVKSLRSTLDHVINKGNIWISTLTEVAEWWIKRYYARARLYKNFLTLVG